MNKFLLAAGVACLGLVASAKDYRVPFYTVGFLPDSTGLMNPDVSTFLKANSDIRIGPQGVALDTFLDLDLVGALKGAWVGGATEGKITMAYQIGKHTNDEGQVDKIVFAMPSSNLSGMSKAVVAQLTVTSENCVSARALFACYNGTNKMRGNFFSLADDGTASQLSGDTAGTVAESGSVNGYGLEGLTATRVVPSGTAKLMFEDCTLDDIRNHHFSGLAMGAWICQWRCMHGYNVVVTDDEDGHATKIRVEMQLIDGSYLKCCVIELTNGEGGVYARNLHGAYTSSSTIGLKFANDNGTYNYTAGKPAGEPASEGYGVLALVATEQVPTEYAPGYLAETDRLIWPGATLDNVFDVGGFHYAGYVTGHDSAIQGFYLRTGSGTDATLEFETRSQMGTNFRAGTVTLTQKADGVWGRVKTFGYGPGLATGPISFLNGGTTATTIIATNPGANGYAVMGLQGRIVAPKALALTDATTDMTDSFTTTCVRVTASTPATLTTSAAPFAKYWDFTDATAPVTFDVAVTNTSLTAGSELILTADATPVNTAFSVAAGKQLTLPNVSTLTGNGLHAHGKVKFLAGDLTTHQRDLQSCSEVELAGTHTITGSNQAKGNASDAPTGFVWNGAGRCVLSGNVTVKGGYNLCYTTTMPGPVVITNGANVVFQDRVTVAAQNLPYSKGHLEICGGTLSGGWIYLLANNSTLQIDLKDGTMTTAITPWVQWGPTKTVQIGQTGGLFAPTSLQPLTGGAYDGTKGTYTLAGGTFVPPAGWTANYPWLNINVPAASNATIRIEQTALLPATTTVDGTLQLASTAADATLTCSTFAGTGPLAVTSGTVRLATPAHALDTHALTVAADATFVKADANDQSFSTGFTNETTCGSLDFSAGGTVTLPARSSIGGALTLGASSTLVLTLDPTATYVANEPLFTAADGITLPEGATLSVRVGSLKLSDDHTQILYVPEDTVPWTACWTGLGDRTNPLDPANWACTNISGVALSNMLPSTPTTILVPDGTTSLNVPAGSALTYYAIQFGETVSLTADCDWRGLGTDKLLPCIIDLQGHKLYVSTLSARAKELADGIYITDTTTDTSAPGELHLDVADGTTWTNNARDLRGNLKFVKEGAGTYQDNLKGQSYTGGTEVAAGLYSALCYTYPSVKTEILTVQSNATFAINATSSTGFAGDPTYVLNGGTMKSAVHHSAGWAGLTHLKLTADSTLDCTLDFGFVGPGHGETTLDLGGHTLTVPIGTSGRNCWFYNVTATEGTVKVPWGGWFVFDKTGVRAPNTDFDFNCALQVYVPVTVRNLTQRYGAQTCAKGGGLISIGGTFTPVVDYGHNFNMLDGSTIDLSSRTNVCNTVNTNDKNLYMRFPTTASTISIKLAGRKIKQGEQVLSWATAPNEAVKFVADAETRDAGITVQRKDDGLYAYRRGFVVIVR